MIALKDEHLVECYRDAVEWGLDEEFIALLRQEIENRKLDISKFEKREKAAI